MRAPEPTHRLLGRRVSLASVGEPRRAERVIASARMVLAVSGLVAIYFDPTQPSRFAALAYGLLLFYVAHSLIVLLFLKIRDELSPVLSWGLHVGDLVWAAFITSFTEGPSSPFFVFFVFVLVAAAYRWGLRETMATAALGISLLFVQALLVTSDSLDGLMTREFELNRLLIRATYLGLIGFLLGYLANAEKQLRAESLLVARILAKARAEKGLKDTLHAVIGELLDLFGASRAMLVTEETFTGRLFAWEVRRTNAGADSTVRFLELPPSDQKRYFFPCSAEALLVVRRENDEALNALGLDGNGRRMERIRHALSDLPSSEPGFRSLAVVSYAARKEWSARLFLFDPLMDTRDEESLRFLQTLVSQTAPAVYNVYLLRRLRSQAGALERARVARELHDGVIQSLVSVEMQIDVQRRRAVGRWGELESELARLQRLLRQEVVHVRELMEDLKPLDVEPDQLLDFLAASVERFQRETGISATFHAELDRVRLSPRVAHEVARIVQEALVNVRKHSGARNVVVRFGADDGWCRVIVDDDGRGFEFTGRLSQDDLDSRRRGPVVIKERVRAIGGALTIESAPGRGSRLEIRFPPKSNE